MVEKEIRRITRERGISRGQLKQALKKQRVSFSEYQEFVRQGLERKSMISREVSSKIKISDDDIASYYIQNSKDASSLIFEYKLAHILMRLTKLKYQMDFKRNLKKPISVLIYYTTQLKVCL